MKAPKATNASSQRSVSTATTRPIATAPAIDARASPTSVRAGTASSRSPPPDDDRAAEAQPPPTELPDAGVVPGTEQPVERPALVELPDAAAEEAPDIGPAGRDRPAGER